MPLPVLAGGNAVALPEAIHAAKFLRTLARAAEKLRLPMGGNGNAEWVEIRDFITQSIVVAGLPNINVAGNGHRYRENFSNDIDLFVSLNIIHQCPFRPFVFSTHLLYAFKGLCEVESNLTHTSCSKVVEKWGDFAINGGSQMGYTGYGNVRLNFVQLPLLIANRAFTAPQLAGYVLQAWPPVALNPTLTGMLGRVFPNAIALANLERALQIAFHVSQPIGGILYRIALPLVLRAAMQVALNYPR